MVKFFECIDTLETLKDIWAKPIITKQSDTTEPMLKSLDNLCDNYLYYT